MPRYKPSRWNRDSNVRDSHNCYAYFLNVVSPKITRACKKSRKRGKKCRRPHPGYSLGFPAIKTVRSHMTCFDMNNRVTKENPHVRVVSDSEKCKPSEYKGALVLASHPWGDKADYHFYRENDSGYWSHKDGPEKATDRDAEGKKIRDPRRASRDYRKGKKIGRKYDRFCNFYCVKRQPEKARIKTRKYRKRGY